MYEVGRVCIKIAGRDAGNLAVVVEKKEKNYVVIDGNVRRRKCNVSHLEPTKDIIKIKKAASTSEVKKAMTSAKLKVKEIKKVKRSPRKVVESKSKKEVAKKKTTKKKTAKK